MEIRGNLPLKTTDFGGLNTFYENPQLVPAPYSPDLLNTQFRRGGVRTRPGLTARGGYATATIPLSIADYVLLNTTQRRLLILDSSGKLVKITGAFAATEDISTDLFDAESAPSLQMISQTAFGRQYIGIGKNTDDIPGAGFHVAMAYDDVNLDPVSPAGPAAAPRVVEGSAGAGPESIAAGTHFYRVCYRTRNGYITPPGPLQLHVSDGGKQVTVSNVSPGPDYVVARIIVATPTNNPGDYFFIPGKMEIGDNVTTTISFDFSDPELINGTAISVRSDPQSDMLNCVSLGEQAGCIFYHNRLGWFGGRAGFRPVGDQWPKNLAFDGGFGIGNGINATLNEYNAPRGWIARKHVTGALGAGFSAGGPDGKMGQGLTIAGDGVHAHMMEAIRTVSPDGLTFNLLPFPTGKDIKVRVRCRKSGDEVDAQSILIYKSAVAAAENFLPPTYATIGGVFMAINEWRWLEAVAVTAAETLQADFAQNTIRFAVSGPEFGLGQALGNGAQIFVDRVEFFLEGQEYEPSKIRWSRVGQPDAYDDAIGTQDFGLNDGQRITGGFVIGDSCFVIKEHSIHVTRDDGANEPAYWNVSVVSPTKGSESVRGYDLGERWAVVASRAGLHFFDGSAAHSLSADIFRTWERINWAAASKLFVNVDADNNRLFVGVPLDDETEAKHLLCLEYLGGSFDSGRWSIWECVDGTFSAGVVYHRPDGIRDVIFATEHSTDSWNLMAIDETTHRDAFTESAQAIVTRYRMPYGPEGDGRFAWWNITANVWGHGTLKVVGYLPDNATQVHEGNRGCQPLALEATPVGDNEWPVDITAERLSWELSTEDLDSWFALNRFVQYLKQKPYSGLRGQRRVS